MKNNEKTIFKLIILEINKFINNIFNQYNFTNYNYNNNIKINFFQKLLIFSIIFIICIKKKNIITYKYDSELNNNYFKIQFDLNLSFHNILKKKINIAIYYKSIKNGGIERLVSLLINYFSNVNIFNTFLLTQEKKDENEYKIPVNTKRIIINKNKNKDLIRVLKNEKIDILIYHFYYKFEIDALNALKTTKTIFYNNSCFLIWIYGNACSLFRTLYNSYKKSKYIISLIPFENSYLFKKWGINSILMNNFLTYEYNSIIPSDLSSKTILMIGRADDKLKRFELGVESMKYIIKEIPEVKMKIISDLIYVDHLKELVSSFNLNNNIEFIGYTSIPEIYFKNASLHIFPSICESFGLVLGETKLFGIPNILIGLDYVSMAKGGTVIIYEDNSEFIANEAIKILKDEQYRKKLGKEARKSMKKFNNELLLKKWIKLILSIYSGDKYYENLRKEGQKISKNEAIEILKNQVKLLKMRNINITDISVKNIENYTYMKNLG